jgi:4-carboxymuconolactone decarboxylase
MRILIWAALLVAMMATAEGQSQTGATAAKLPADIDPVTLSRFPPVRREDMKESVKKFYDEQNLPSPDGTPFLQRGPQHLYLYSPAVADTMGRLVSSLREQGVLGNRFMEIAILVTAREISHQFIWSAHEPAARRSGVEPAIIDIIKYNQDVSGLGEKETVIIRFGRQLLREKKVSPSLFAKSIELLGRQGVVELTALMGSYVATGMMLDAADQQQPTTRPALLPVR